MSKKRLDTEAVHAGQTSDPTTGSRAVPIGIEDADDIIEDIEQTLRKSEKT